MPQISPEELRVEVERFQLHELKNSITTLPQTLKEADGIILATTVEWYGIGGYMQQFLDWEAHNLLIDGTIHIFCFFFNQRNIILVIFQRCDIRNIPTYAAAWLTAKNLPGR